MHRHQIGPTLVSSRWIAPIGQQPGGGDNDQDQSGTSQRQAEAGQLEHLQFVVARRLQQAAQHQVGAGADGGDRPAQDGGVRQGDQEPGGGPAVALRPATHGGHQHGHDGSVGQERRGRTGGGQQPEERHPGSRSPVQHPGHHWLQRVGFGHRAGHHIQRPDGDGSGVGEPPECLVGVDHPEQEQPAHSTQHPGGGREPVADETGAHSRQHCDGEHRIAIHLGKCYGLAI